MFCGNKLRVLGKFVYVMLEWDLKMRAANASLSGLKNHKKAKKFSNNQKKSCKKLREWCFFIKK